MRFDNGPEFVAHAVDDWCRFNSAASLFIDPGSPWQNVIAELLGIPLEDGRRLYLQPRPRTSCPCAATKQG